MAVWRTLLLSIAVSLSGFGLPGALAQTPKTLLSPAINVLPDDPFGEQVTMSERTIVYFEGSGVWDSAFETIVEAFRSLYGAMGQLGAKPDGRPMAIYTATSDTGFEFQAAVPVAQAPALPLPSNIKVGKSPAGRALKFVHRGSYDEMDTTYEAIAHHLEERNLEAQDLFIEQYIKDPVTTPEEDLVIEIYVPLK